MFLKGNCPAESYKTLQVLLVLLVVEAKKEKNHRWMTSSEVLVSFLAVVLFGDLGSLFILVCEFGDNSKVQQDGYNFRTDSFTNKLFIHLAMLWTVNGLPAHKETSAVGELAK